MIAESVNYLLEIIFGPVEGSISALAPAGILVLGFIIGLRHSLEADHIAAVSTIVMGSRQRLRNAPLLGFLWGLGHTAALFAVGLAVLLLAISIPERVSGMLEFGVGMMLVFLGVTALTGFKIGRFLSAIKKRGRRHSHVHLHEDAGLVHSHAHDHDAVHKHSHKSLLVGLVHGMAGSGALVILVVSTIQSVPLGLAYIAIFGAGSIAGMAGMSALIAVPLAKSARYVRLNLVLRYAAAIVTILIGANIIYDLGIVEQVFIQ